MKLELRRTTRTLQTTIGELYVDGVFECFICEDRYRPVPEPKVPRATCIPLGTYDIEITNSPRFSQLAGHPVSLPLVKNVPGFEGIRIHPGNTADDTEGCLLPGRVKHVDRVDQSKLAFDALFAKLSSAQARKEPITIDIALS